MLRRSGTALRVAAVLALSALGCSAPSMPPMDTGDAAVDDAGAAASDAGVDAAPVCTSGNTIGGPTSPTSRNVMVNGVSRAYVLDVPPSAIDAMSSGCGAPILIGLHGAGDTATNFLSATGLEATASDSGFVLAGPQALSGLWVLSPP